MSARSPLSPQYSCACTTSSILKSPRGNPSNRESAPRAPGTEQLPRHLLCCRLGPVVQDQAPPLTRVGGDGSYPRNWMMAGMNRADGAIPRFSQLMMVHWSAPIRSATSF